MSTQETPHYFSSQPQTPAHKSEIEVKIRNHQYRVCIAQGVFSSHGLDKGTRVLFEKVPELEIEKGNALDIGCGWGPITLALAHEYPHMKVWGVDVNERARALTRENIDRSGLHATICSPEEAYSHLENEKIQLIWANPPVRIGKEALHELLRTWLGLLAADGHAFFVVQKNLGADSLRSWIEHNIMPCDKYASASGFRILHCGTPLSRY